jgi:hypothetical protein
VLLALRLLFGLFLFFLRLLTEPRLSTERPFEGASLSLFLFSPLKNDLSHLSLLVLDHNRVRSLYSLVVVETHIGVVGAFARARKHRGPQWATLHGEGSICQHVLYFYL